MTTTHATTAVYDPGSRKTAITVGLLFLSATLTFAIGDAIVLDALLPSRRSVDSTLLAAGVGLQAVCALAVTGLGVALLRPLARFHRALAYGHLAFRALEGVVILAIGAYMLVTTQLVNYERVIYVFTGVAGLMFTLVLLRSGLVPGWLARLGVVGYIAILAVLPIELLGIASLNSLPGMLLYVPGGLFELLLPILLITRGFRRVETPTEPHIDDPEPAHAPA